MRLLSVGAFMVMATCWSAEWKIVVTDEAGRGIPGAEIEAVLAPSDDPRLSQVSARIGRSDAEGVFRFKADDKMVLSRARAKRTGYFPADADHRHGIGRPGANPELKLTLPKLTELVSLHYREVRLRDLPKDRWIGFDAEKGDAISPWGRGSVTDFRFMIGYEQAGWTESPAALVLLRRTPEGARMDETEWVTTYGRFKGELRISFPNADDGIRRTPGFWPYCRLKMPAEAPLDGYQAEQRILFDTLDDTEPMNDLTGYYLRLRTEPGAGNQVVSAHYAKIHGRIEAGPGRVAFRFYYNPRADDRRLAFDPGRNLLRPAPGEPAYRFETQQP